jgi:hypothetical protein
MTSLPRDRSRPCPPPRRHVFKPALVVVHLRRTSQSHRDGVHTVTASEGALSASDHNLQPRAVGSLASGRPPRSLVTRTVGSPLPSRPRPGPMGNARRLGPRAGVVTVSVSDAAAASSLRLRRRVLAGAV